MCMSVSDSQKKATKKYRSNNYTHIQISLNKNHDSDVIEHLNGIENKRAYIMGLIKDDMLLQHGLDVACFDEFNWDDE